MDGSDPLATASDRDMAATLIKSTPIAERSKFVKGLITSLDPEDEPGILLVANLVDKISKDHVTEIFLSSLEQMIIDGHLQSAVSVSRKNHHFGLLLLRRATDFISFRAKSDSGLPFTKVHSYLVFVASFAAQLSWSQVHSQLLVAALDILSSSGQDLHTEAKNVVLELLTVSQPDAESPGGVEVLDVVWLSVKTLTNSSTKLSVASAYAIWLRWLLSGPVRAKHHFGTDEYWYLIQRGLRDGDAEQRKLCLNILRISVSMDEEHFASHIAQQFDRYATVFETVVLSRYINQIMECEDDLNFLANRSSLDRSWLATLLGSALDIRMQEATRKFIGNWVMQSKPDLKSETLAFVEYAFLPWAIQGQHFVATLKKSGEQMVCQHGQNLSDYIKAIRRQSQDPSEVTDLVVDIMWRKKNTMFAYCTVWLLDALEDSLHQEHKEKLSQHRGLPEVARDYIKHRILAISHIFPSDSRASIRQAKERSTMDKIDLFIPDIGILNDIWADMEYLEFPKRLLMAFIHPLFSEGMLLAAIGDAHIAADVTEKVIALQHMALTKTFLFPPLVNAVRSAVLRHPMTTEILNVINFVLLIAEQPPAPNTDLKLEESIIRLTLHDYEYYLGDPLSYGMAAYFDLISRLTGHPDIVQTVLERLLSRWRSQKVPPPTVSPWKTTLQLQVVLLCVEQRSRAADEKLSKLIEDLFHILAIEPLPNYRYLLEATVVRLILKHKLHDNIVDRLQTKDHHSNPKHLASLMKIGGTVVSTADTSQRFAERLMTVFVPLAASSKIVIRHEAQWQVPLLMDEARSRRWKSIRDNEAFVALDEYVRSLERFHEPPPERIAGRFDPEKDYTLANLIEGRWYTLDSMDAPMTSREDFVRLYAREPLPNAPSTCLPLGNPLSRSNTTPSDTSSARLHPNPGPQTSETVSLALQTKGTAYLSRALTSTTTTATRPKPNLVIIGSLVDNPYNLGGLSRVSEIFGAAALTLQNQNVLGNKEFTSVAVSSHLHFPIIQLSSAGVPVYLRERKKEGYVVVGIEQTDRSVVLGAPGVVLPEKCLLVVGSEREGIPAAVLLECEMLVEITQEGVTRSLNVQTAVAIVLFEYSRQHSGGGGRA